MRHARWTWIAAAVGALALLVINTRIQPWTLDDAYISFRYAENLATGHGPVYNAGERVEGYTTPLWVGLLALGHALGADTRTLAKALGLGLSLGTLALLAGARRVHPGIPAGAGPIAAGLLGGCGVFGAWAMPGMEVPLVALLLTATALLHARDASGRGGWTGAGVAGALALLARPDSVVVVGVLGLDALRRAVGLRSARPLRALGLTLGLYLPYFLARWAWYGWPLPNTFYAKVGATGAQAARGLDYALGAGSTLAPLWLPQLLLLPFAWVAVQRFRGLGVLWAAALAHVAYVVAVGGDVMPAHRFFAGITPLLALGGGLALSLVPRLGPLLTVGCIALGLWQFTTDRELEPRIRRAVVGRNGEEVGRWLREHVDPDLLLATNTAGSVAYFSRLRTIDMLGLNDAHIAHTAPPDMGRRKAGHEKADGAYVFARSPDLVHLGSARGSATPVFGSDRELVAQPGFDDRYVLQRYRLPSGATLALWVKRELVDGGRMPRSPDR